MKIAKLSIKNVWQIIIPLGAYYLLLVVITVLASKGIVEITNDQIRMAIIISLPHAVFLWMQNEDYESALISLIGIFLPLLMVGFYYICSSFVNFTQMPISYGLVSDAFIASALMGVFLHPLVVIFRPILNSI